MSLQPIIERDAPLAWCIAMTEPGRELRAWEGLREQGFTAYLPMETVWKNFRNKPRERTERPLFVGYMFVGVASWQCHHGMKAIAGIRGYVKNGRGEPAAVDPLFVYGLQASQCAGELNRTPPAAKDPRPDAPPTVTIDLAGPYADDIKEIVEATETGRQALLLSEKYRVKLEIERPDRLAA